ncbi:energy transducer TonB [Luteimonas fraxinea]|uniref:Protein TonB n=1 Tax=Luteimonas fraxinea TaxID=2901869 RepID=A0ABS8UF67_9GAMM|nr:energy transducer TonB [Luteimonas fraxinea]MCD9097535.1 energy transducer TonB [Luteimonas fraxinea]UHH11784.1 energy transducer TonB [Luteimonas fraxinea]
MHPWGKMMVSKIPTTRRASSARLAAAVGLACVLAACGRSDEAEAPVAAAPGAVTAQASQQAAARQQAADDAIAGLSVDELRSAGAAAYQESRLYAPAGENAMEYYLALREKQAGDAAASSALIDLLPMSVIATEQSRDRGDYAEARRLLGLIERADSKHPALERLRASIATSEEQAAARVEQQKLTAEQEAQRAQTVERERAAQQQQQQAAAAQQLAQQQTATDQAAREEAARQAAAREEAARPQPARPEPAPQETPAPAPAAPAPAAAPAQLRPLSTPAPRYPADALRAGTSGEVMVEFTVGVDGSVSNARVVRADPPRTFDREALAAVRRWRFEPVPAPVTTRRTIGFAPTAN